MSSHRLLQQTSVSKGSRLLFLFPLCVVFLSCLFPVAGSGGYVAQTLRETWKQMIAKKSGIGIYISKVTQVKHNRPSEKEGFATLNYHARTQPAFNVVGHCCQV